mgnify:CR=1 FL=1
MNCVWTGKLIPATVPGVKITENVVFHANLLEAVKGANALVFVVPQ